MDTLFLRRVASNENGTTGALIGQDDWPAGVTLEPPVPIIPAGVYDVIPFFSPEHQRNCFLIQNVPGHEGVEMHIGNRKIDTKGCVLTAVAYSHFQADEMVLGSADEFGHLWEDYGKIGFKLAVRDIA